MGEDTGLPRQHRRDFPELATQTHLIHRRQPLSAQLFDHVGQEKIQLPHQLLDVKRQAECDTTGTWGYTLRRLQGQQNIQCPAIPDGHLRTAGSLQCRLQRDITQILQQDEAMGGIIPEDVGNRDPFEGQVALHVHEG
jgi:hypothetical protein